MSNFWKIVNDVIHQADVLLLVLDARLVNETRNIEIENKVLKLNKPLIYVVTKCDLVKKEEVEKYKKILKPLVFISSKEFLGVKLLRERIIIEGKRIGKIDANVGVLGYPNVGKSSLINALIGRKSAMTSSTSGQTKGVQKVRESGRIMFLDTPGVIPYLEKNDIKHTITASVDYNKSKEPEMAVFEIMEKFPGVIESYYNVSKNDGEESLEEISIKLNLLKKGGSPDSVRAAKQILKDWQTGKIKIE